MRTIITLLICIIGLSSCTKRPEVKTIQMTNLDNLRVSSEEYKVSLSDTTLTKLCRYNEVKGERAYVYYETLANLKLLSQLLRTELSGDQKELAKFVANSYNFHLGSSLWYSKTAYIGKPDVLRLQFDRDPKSYEDLKWVMFLIESWQAQDMEGNGTYVYADYSRLLKIMPSLTMRYYPKTRILEIGKDYYHPTEFEYKNQYGNKESAFDFQYFEPET